MTRRELADRLGERLWTVEEWEEGRKPVPPEKVDAIAEITGVSLDLSEADASRSEGGGVEAQQRWIRSLGPVDEPVRSQLTVDQIREPVLPRGLRGFDESATRRWLAEVAADYERLVAERDELRNRVDELGAPDALDEQAQVVVERDDLRQRVARLEAALDQRKDYDEVVSARSKLEREAAELWELLSTRDDYDAIVAERNELRARLEEAQAGKETEQSLSRALLAASRAGEELIKEAEAEADAMIAAARAAAAETERELESLRQSFETEREAFLEALRAEALEIAREDLAALQQEAELLVPALTALTHRIDATARLRLRPAEDEPVGGDLLDDLQARTESSGTQPPPELD